MVLLCIIKDAMYKHRIIECNVNDSSDWDWIYDEAVQNTLKEYFKWATNSIFACVNFEWALVWDDCVSDINKVRIFIAQ